ncbi:MAG: hypothetical protein ACYTGH_19165 [Planctomycetota bacterium]|jgi:type I restriction enzyme M protein
MSGYTQSREPNLLSEAKMAEMSRTLYAQMKESAKLDKVIRKNLEGLGYGEA